MYFRIDKDNYCVNLIRNHFSGKRDVRGHITDGSWQTSRFIQISSAIKKWDVHYEYRVIQDRNGNWNGKIELHFEGEDWGNRYGRIIDALIERTQDQFKSHFNAGGYAFTSNEILSYPEDSFLKSIDRFINLFDRLLSEVADLSPKAEPEKIPDNGSIDEHAASVEIYIKKLGEVVSLPLQIPDYQRIYCWEEENVKQLLDDIFNHLQNKDKSDVPYRLGAIILHRNGPKYDIIDGQQRLVTLCLLLYELGLYPKLLDESFSSKRSIEYVAYNKTVIAKYVRRHPDNIHNVKSRMLQAIEFSVLVLQNASLDLAYTFFSNRNSRGVPLSDYDLLKAHHLRYIPASSEHQAMQAAATWNKMIEASRKSAKHGNDDDDPDYVTTLDTYIYRLRKWMRKKDVDDSTDKYRIKKEYEAAPVLEELAPFGGQFYFNEKIQGGNHFFSYVEQHLDKFRQFKERPEYGVLHDGFGGGSAVWYRDVIESLVFGYYLKFGHYYLAEAIVVIMRIILQHRYDNPRALKAAVVKHAGDSELILMIDQASSPSFFLAEAKGICKELSFPNRQNMIAVQRSMRQGAFSISNNLENMIVVESFKYLNR